MYSMSSLIRPGFKCSKNYKKKITKNIHNNLLTLHAFLR